MGLVILPTTIAQVTLNIRGAPQTAPYTWACHHKLKGAHPKQYQRLWCVTINIRVPHMGLVILPTIIPQVTLNIRERTPSIPVHKGVSP